MKKILISGMILFLCICCATENKYAQKPFVIMEKYYIYSDKKNAEYRFEDVQGRSFMFYDRNNLYEIGDTIN